MDTEDSSTAVEQLHHRTAFEVSAHVSRMLLALATDYRTVPACLPACLPQVAASAAGAPFRPVSLTFIDLNYSINLKKGKAVSQKVVISNANGYIKAGTFVAIMGPSGVVSLPAWRTLPSTRPTNLHSLGLCHFSQDRGKQACSIFWPDE